jgi:hypothetical protein
VKLPIQLNIPRRAKSAPAHSVNGDNAATNGTSIASVTSALKRKRSIDEVELQDQQTRKKGKVPETNGQNGTDIVVIDDDGAITIDD